MAELYRRSQFRYAANRSFSRIPVASRHTPDLNQLRRRLRGLQHAALLQSLQEQLETFQVAAIAADNSGRYVAANTKVCHLTGYSRAELLRLHVRDVTTAKRRDVADDLWKRFIHTGSQTGEYVIQRKDGTTVAVEYAAYASVAPGVHVSLLTPLEEPSSI